ncbi:substrate-binding periplasmic protein [Amantichitinum ursilacus]|uniref:Bacterial extracellular solute-binding protein, family 3 n=1 Tax=Amantichitinum ursilacus TaxID=857265 RepID=A0A0N0XK54_9NEIS|nr:transporter substrate-binding domain-containing protein [Amantichitinum ursilacus]KPC53898.1 Bacterial extracellular solute-binding protein, family 3 [Amantichitinum ursilacus]
MRKARGWLLNLVLTALMLVHSAAGAATHSAPNQVLIGAEDDWYPYSGRIDGVARGMAEDIVQAAFAAVGVQAQFVSLPYARCIRMVRAGELVGCFDTSRTALNEADYLWPQHPLFNSRALIFARASRTTVRHDLGVADLIGKRVAITNGYEYGTEFDSNQDIRKEVTSQSIMGLRMLLLGRVDYALAFEKVAQSLLRTNPEELGGKVEPVGLAAETSLYCVFSRSHPDSVFFLQKFNDGMSRIIASGEYKTIEARWK